MNLELCEKLESLNEEESKSCNGGSAITLTKNMQPPIIIDTPRPDGDHRL